MEDLKSIILDYANKGASFEALEAEMVRIAKANPELSSDLLNVLADAQEEGLVTDLQYNDLLAKLVAADTISATDAGQEDADEETGKTHDPKQFFSKTGFQKVETVGPGTVIKERFELMDVLGVGGMGMVYKARDLIKVEAKDRNPYLAIKVLNENFRKHPESFIALQRECSRTQKLAHPNIATVYDFDRFGSMVYMTMQLLEGKPLNDFIKEDLPKGGLSFEEAMPLIRDMGNALVYAHSQHIVHSDFKPGNSFITENDGVQVLDFGIARAVKRPGQQDTTLFDAGKLGALTPAYASCEMLEEEEPDPRDDIYALAVVSYILLSGDHPFDKFPATLARDHGMEPKPIKKLSRAQNQALARGLSFFREECTPTVDGFLDELSGNQKQKSPKIKYAAAASIAAVALVLIGLFPVQQYLQKQREAEVAAQLASADVVLVRQTLDELAKREDISSKSVLSAARDDVMKFYGNEIESALTGQLGPNNFVLAQTLVDEVRQLYPESNEVQGLVTRVRQHKARMVDFVDDAFYKIVNQRDIKAVGDGRSVPQMMRLLTKIDRNHELLKDARIPVIYEENIDQHMQHKRLLEAEELSKEALRLYPDNEILKFLEQELQNRSKPGYVAKPRKEKQVFERRQKLRNEKIEAATVEAVKHSILIKTQSGRPDKAVDFLDVLSELIPSDSVFLTSVGPKMIADSYLRQAEPLAEAGQYDRALEMVQAGLNVFPTHEALQAAGELYKNAIGL